MRVLENPVVRNNAAWDSPKSTEIFGFSTVFLGFFAFRGKIACFYRLFYHFLARKPQKIASSAL